MSNASFTTAYEANNTADQDRALRRRNKLTARNCVEIDVSKVIAQTLRKQRKLMAELGE